MGDDVFRLVACDEYWDHPEHRIVRETPTDYQIIWVVGGKGIATTEGLRFEVTAGDLLIFSTDVANAYASDAEDPWHILWMHFAGVGAREIHQRLRSYGGPCVRLGLDERLIQRFEELIAETVLEPDVKKQTGTVRDEFWIRRFGSWQPSDPIYAAGLAMGVLGMMAHQLETRRASDPSPSFDAALVRTYIQNHLAETIRLDALANELGLSIPHFLRLFRRAFGASPMQYITRQKVIKAASLLRETQLPIKAVADALGYSDRYYFQRVFKKATDLTPSQYRARSR